MGCKLTDSAGSKICQNTKGIVHGPRPVLPHIKTPVYLKPYVLQNQLSCSVGPTLGCKLTDSTGSEICQNAKILLLIWAVCMVKKMEPIILIFLFYRYKETFS